eukprot:7142118-Prymnesium_polylepis.4
MCMWHVHVPCACAHARDASRACDALTVPLRAPLWEALVDARLLLLGVRRPRKGHVDLPYAIQGGHREGSHAQASAIAPTSDRTHESP